MIKVESKFKDFGIQIPTDISEITSEALDAILNNVVIAKHYCVVALCQNESLFGVINNKVSTVEVMPIIAKISKEDAELIGMNQMDKIIIDRSILNVVIIFILNIMFLVLNLLISILLMILN